jgi:hypothetical protein
VEVGDGNAFQGRGERGGGRLEAIADEQQGIRRGLPKRCTNGPQGPGCLI